MVLSRKSQISQTSESTKMKRFELISQIILSSQLTDTLLEFDQGVSTMMFTPIYILFYLIYHIFLVIFWPFFNLTKVYWSQGQYRTSAGEVKTTKHLVLESKRTQSMRAHMFEVCIESTFQVPIPLKSQ